MEEKEIINEDQQNNQELSNEELPTEEVQEQTQVEESSQEESTNSVIEISKPLADGKPYYEVVEEERQKVIGEQKKSSRLSTISIVLVLALSITGIFLLQVNAIISYVLMGVALTTLIVFSIIIRRVARPDIQGYIVKASTAVNEFTFADNRFTNVKYDPTDKIQLEDVSSDGAFLDLVRTASRNVCEGSYNGRSFKVCEAAFFKAPQGRKQMPVFIGKYLSTTNNLHFEGRIVLVSKGETDADIPDGLGDLLQVENEGKFFAYAPSENSYKELDKKFIKAIKEIEVKNHLMNLTVILWAGRTIVYASYDDATITLPFYEKYQEDTAVQYRENLIQILEATQLINKE